MNFLDYELYDLKNVHIKVFLMRGPLKIEINQDNLTPCQAH
jgi:hypothetical protein